MSTKKLVGTMSTFGGPDDKGVSESEGLALCEEHEMDLFPATMWLSEEEAGAPGLARRLNPDARYIACRWDYDETPRDYLQGAVVIVTNPKTGKSAAAHPIDWGPHTDTGRVADLSPGLAAELGLATDDTVELALHMPPVEEAMRYKRIVVSSGHGLKIRGAADILDEVDEARAVVDCLVQELTDRGVEVTEFHDNTSTTQDQNLKTIVAFHNSQQRDLDISVHFNAYQHTAKPMGTEVLYVSQATLANQLSSAISACGLINRGGKKRTDLYFLNHTAMPSVLLEICFVDSESDAEVYGLRHAVICKAIATTLAGALRPHRARK